MDPSPDPQYPSDKPIMSKLNSSSNVALEKLKRRATTIRAIASFKPSEFEGSSKVSKDDSGINLSPLSSIRRANARNRQSVAFSKHLELSREEINAINTGDFVNQSAPESLPNEHVKDDILPEPSLSSVSEVTEEHESLPELNLYLQLDNKVKKIKCKGRLTLASLKIMFVENFQYNPGGLEFPDLYIKDVKADIFYQLEDPSEVVDGSVLKLNVEVSSADLKKEMESHFNSLSRELKDLRRIITKNNKETIRSTNAISMALPSSTSKLTDMVRLVMAQNNKEATIISPASTAETKKKIDLDPIRDEIKALRQDLSVVRQVSKGFQSEAFGAIKEISKSTAVFKEQLASESESVHKLIAVGRDRMEQNALTLANKLEEIQNNVDDFRTDLVQRRCQPSDIRMKYTVKLLDEVNQMLSGEAEFIAEVKPSWKKAWEVTLQNIVQEQQSLKEHESIVEDMGADFENLSEMFQQLQKFLELKKQSKHSRKSFEVAQPDDEFSRDAVLQEIQCVDANSERRLQALEQAIETRNWELRNKVDPFEEELTDFVGSSKLRKTGGTEELDKKRKEQDLLNLKAMLAPRPKPPSSKSSARP